eukprot:403356448
MSDHNQSQQNQHNSEQQQQHSHSHSRNEQQQTQEQLPRYQSPFNAFKFQSQRQQESDADSDGKLSEDSLISTEERDMSDSEFKALTPQERTKIINRRLKLKPDMFNSNQLIMQSNFTNQELLSIHTEGNNGEWQYFTNLLNCQGKQGGSRIACLMNLDCKSELIKYSRCLVQYQKSGFLCKVPKNDLFDCYQRHLKSANLIINKID